LLCAVPVQNKTTSGPQLAENNGSGSLHFSVVCPTSRYNPTMELLTNKLVNDSHILEKRCQWYLPDTCQGEPKYHVQLYFVNKNAADPFPSGLKRAVVSASELCSRAIVGKRRQQ